MTRTHDKVRRATLAELADSGYAALTVDAVARRSGVARTTIYRHWESPRALALDALATLNRQPQVDQPDGSPAEQALLLLTHLASALSDPLIGGCLVALVEGSRHDPALRALLADFSAHRNAALVRLVGQESADALAGAVFYRVLVAARPPTTADLAQLVATVL